MIKMRLTWKFREDEGHGEGQACEGTLNASAIE